MIEDTSWYEGVDLSNPRPTHPAALEVLGRAEAKAKLGKTWSMMLTIRVESHHGGSELKALERV